VSWESISLGELQQLVSKGLQDCSDEGREFFARVRIPFSKWRLSPRGDKGGGFWAVAVHKDRVLWFNDIEEGFNVSTFTLRGEIPKDQYWCNQDSLAWALPRLEQDVGPLV
jgi:hypothetical protein